MKSDVVHDAVNPAACWAACCCAWRCRLQGTARGLGSRFARGAAVGVRDGCRLLERATNTHDNRCNSLYELTSW